MTTELENTGATSMSLQQENEISYTTSNGQESLQVYAPQTQNEQLQAENQNISVEQDEDFEILGQKPVIELTEDEVKRFQKWAQQARQQLNLQEDQQLTEDQINQYIESIKLQMKNQDEQTKEMIKFLFSLGRTCEIITSPVWIPFYIGLRAYESIVYIQDKTSKILKWIIPQSTKEGN